MPDMYSILFIIIFMVIFTAVAIIGLREEDTQ